MSYSKHTEGSWELEANAEGGWSIYADKGRVIIASRSDWPSRSEESIANGHLLSAASDLLRALKLAKDHSELEDGILDMVEDAIAKAEGRMLYGMRVIVDEALPPDAFRIVERRS